MSSKRWNAERGALDGECHAWGWSKDSWELGVFSELDYEYIFIH
jgi:hypothetical protein